MSFSPVRLGCLLITAVVAAAVAAQATSAPHRTHASDQSIGRAPARHQAVKASGRQGARLGSRLTTPRRTGDGQEKAIFLTFDDGPSDLYTPAILRVLAKHHARATFFALGLQVREFPHLIPMIKAAGHTVGNHTYDHRSLPALSPAKVRWELQHGPRSKCFRPPFRATNTQITSIAASYGMRQVLWTVDTLDWQKPGTASIERKLLTGARPGAIILMHDGGGDRSQTIAALDRALTKLSGRGYTFTSLDC